jgi:SAM-dependent methyltransferase
VSISERDHIDGAYWDRATRPHRGAVRQSWRTHCDALHRELLDRSLGDRRGRRALKTDAFDEATHAGLVPGLTDRVDAVHAIDISIEVALGATGRYPELRVALADVRTLPYTDGAFDQVVSNSTLDHFPARADIVTALRELHRVTADGGTLVITMDNLDNPIVRLRSVLPQRALQWLRLVPYYVGATVTEAELVSELERAGFSVRRTGTMMHVPRAPAMAVCHLVDALDRLVPRRVLLRILATAEWMERLPTRRRTGYYVTATATRPARPAGSGSASP